MIEEDVVSKHMPASSSREPSIRQSKQRRLSLSASGKHFLNRSRKDVTGSGAMPVLQGVWRPDV